MKCLDRIFLCVMLATGWCRCSGAAPASQESAEAFVHATAGTNVSEVVLYSPTEAAGIIDTVFKASRKDASDDPDWKFERMKHLVADDLAVLIGYDDDDAEPPDWTKTFPVRVYRLVHRFHDREPIATWINGVSYRSYGPRADLVYEEAVLRKSNGRCLDGGIYDSSVKSKESDILFGPDQSVALDPGVATNAELSVIADVETVTLSAVSGLERVIAAGGGRGGVPPIGHYRVSLLVRTAPGGALAANRLVFMAKTGEANATVGGHWLFYRGMTLKVGLRQTPDGFSICRIEPVLPYPPHTTEDVVVCANGVPRTSRFSLINGWADCGECGGVTILYGDHTRADYLPVANLIEGHCGTLPDFGPQSWVCVWTHGAGARLDYWRNAWFADVQSYSVLADEEDPASEMPLFLPATDAFNSPDRAADRLRFTWWDAVFPRLSFKPPATIADVADFLTLATRPCPCADSADVAYRLVAEPCVAARPVRPLVATNLGAWDLLHRVLSENGCTMTLNGTNITLSAELTDDEIAVPRVEELAAQLEAEGFGSTAGARYAFVSFWAVGLPSSDYAAGAVSLVAPHAWVDEESRMEGNGWVRTAADGTEEFLAYDAVWWSGEKAGDSNRKTDEELHLSSTPVRFRRDFFRTLDMLNLLADGAFGWEPYYNQGKIDVACLALALHAAQAGFKDEGQQLIEALWRRPAAAKQALARIRARIARPEAKCRTVRDCCELLREQRKNAAAAAGETEEEEDEDESDAD